MLDTTPSAVRGQTGARHQSLSTRSADGRGRQLPVGDSSRLPGEGGGTRKTDQPDLSWLARLADAARQIHPTDSATQDDTARAIVGAARELIAGTTWATITTGKRKHHTVRVLAATHGAPEELDRVQQQAKAGPDLEAMWENPVVRCADLLHDGRWPDFRSAALGVGVRSVVSVRLALAGGRTLGSLNLYAAAPADPQAPTPLLASAFAAHAAIALDIAGLEQAVHNREVIGQAKGILMERRRVTPQEAFDLLVTASQHTNRSLHDVAGHLVHTGDLPTR